VLDDEPENLDVALVGEKPVGWVCTRMHPGDNMVEIYVLVVDPDYQRQGIGKALLAKAKERARSAGMSMVMVETGDDPGHTPARGMYEANGFERWPVARYFLNLED
jgi:ribosomal protein S18 acetylase RimI-like enzyme